MKNNILIVKNITREGPGLLETVLIQKNIGYTVIDLDQGDDFPPVESYGALVVLGGPNSANDKSKKMEIELMRIQEALAAQIPYLGICLGLQALVKAAGGSVTHGPVKEVGFVGPDGNNYAIELTEQGERDPLFSGHQNPFTIFQLHGETVELSEGMELLGVGKYCRNQIVKIGRNAYGIQCHFELTRQLLDTWADEDPDLMQLDKRKLRESFEVLRDEYTETGKLLFQNFLLIAGLTS